MIGKLVAQGIRLVPGKGFIQALGEVRLFDGRALPPNLKAGLIREWERLQVVEAQLRAVEAGSAAHRTWWRSRRVSVPPTP